MTRTLNIKKHTKKQKLVFLLRIPKRKRGGWQNHEIKVLQGTSPSLSDKSLHENKLTVLD